MTVDDAEKLLVEKVNNLHREDLHAKTERGGIRPSFFVLKTRQDVGDPVKHRVRVMKRLEIGSPEMRDDFHQLFKPGKANWIDSAGLEAIDAFRQEMIKIVPNACQQLVNAEANSGTGGDEWELKNAVYFDIVAAANRADEVVAALVRLAKRLS